MAVWEDDREAAEDGLARLVGRSLLSRAGDGRYGQHALSLQALSPAEAAANESLTA